jgi:hypothetical protein
MKTLPIPGSYKEVSDTPNLYSVINNVFLADLRLSVPTPKGFIPDQATRRQIAKFFPILVTGRQRNRIRIKDFEEILPVSMNRWNKLQILNGGDQIRCLDTDSEVSTLGKRDNSFVRVSDASLLRYNAHATSSIHYSQTETN